MWDLDTLKKINFNTEKQIKANRDQIFREELDRRGLAPPPQAIKFEKGKALLDLICGNGN